LRALVSKILLIAVVLGISAQGTWAVTPPSPGVDKPAGFREFLSRLNKQYPANRRGNSRADSGQDERSRGAGPYLAGAAPPGTRVPVILAGYADRAGVIAPQIFRDKLFGAYLPGSMRDYYAEVSLGRFALQGEVYGWVAAPRTQAQYNAGGPLGESSTYPDSPEGFVADAVRAADRVIDFALYDNDGPDGLPNSGDDDGYVDALIVIHPGGDAANGDKANLWSHTGKLGAHAVETGDPAAGGGRIKVDLYSLVPELAGDGSSPVAAGIGVFCHEFGHQLGLVDLYDTDSETGGGNGAGSYGIGVWGLMGLGTNGADGKSPDRPTHLSAWSKLRLGWVSPAAEDTTGEIALPPVNSSGQVVRVWDNDERSLSYFLLSYRKRTGFDSALPGEGLLIWHVDERVFDNNDPAYKLVDLEEADSRRDLDRGANFGDAGDPFPGSAGKTGFATLTDPSSSRYDGTPSGVTVTGIRIEKDSVRFSLSQPRRAGLTLFYDEDQPARDRGFGYGDKFAYGGVVFTAPVAGVLSAVSTYFIYENMGYNLEIYTGVDSGRMRCLAVSQAGEVQGSGWRTLELGQPIFLQARDTVVAVVGYRTKGFDDLWPVPYDPTGRPEGRSLVSYTGLGAFEPFERDLTIRALLKVDNVPSGEVLRIKPGLELRESTLDFGRCFIGETYSLALELFNPGLKGTPLSGIRVQGDWLETEDVEPFVPCGEVLELPLVFTPREPGAHAGTVTVTPLSEGLEELSANLTSDVSGYSVRYDSSAVPGGYAVFDESAHGAVTFSMTESGLLCGVRTFLLQDSMRVGLKIWAGVERGVPRCLVAETLEDALIIKSGWHQIFLPAPVAVDSADTFTADVEFSTPGRPYNTLVPVDTLRQATVPGYYNLKTGERWLSSSHPVAVRALILPPESYTGDLVRKKPAAAVSDSLVQITGITAGQSASGGLWLFNRGCARLDASLWVSEPTAEATFHLGSDSLSVSFVDSVFIAVTCVTAAPGADTSLLTIETSDKDFPRFVVPLVALTERFELAYDEQGHTAAAGFNDSTAWGAVVFDTPWEGVLEAVKVYFNTTNMRLESRVYKTVRGEAGWEDLAGTTVRDRVPSSGWQEITLDSPVIFAAGDSFAVVASFTVNPTGNLYPLSLDTKGEPSGRSWAVRSLDREWEHLDYDINLRALLRAIQFAGFKLSGLVLDNTGQPVPAVSLSLTSPERSYMALSDSSGLFVFASVAPRDYTLGGELEGYSFGRLEISVHGPVESISLTGLRLVPGDLDASGKVDIFDLITLLQVLGGVNPQVEGADLDRNGKVDIFDLIGLLKLLGG